MKDILITPSFNHIGDVAIGETKKVGENLNENKIIWKMPTIVKSEKGNPEKGHIYEVKEKATIV